MENTDGSTELTGYGWEMFSHMRQTPSAFMGIPGQEAEVK